MEEKLFLVKIRKDIIDVIKGLKKENPEVIFSPMVSRLAEAAGKIFAKLNVMRQPEEWFEPGKIIVILSDIKSCDCYTCEKQKTEGFSIRDKDHAGFLYDQQDADDVRYVELAPAPDKEVL